MMHERTDATTPERRTRTVSTVAIVASGAVMAVLVVHDGSPEWRVVRGLAVAGLTAAAVFASRRLPTRPAGGVELLVGLVVFSTGIGIAVPHLSKLGPDPIGLIGALGVVAGLALLVIGGVDLLRSTPIWLRLLTIPALVVATVLALWMPDEIASNEWLRRQAPDAVDLWVAPSSGHIGALHEHPEEYERRVVGFLDRSLAESSS